MINMNNQRVLLVIASLVFSLNSFAQQKGLFQTSPADAVKKQPVQQSQQSSTSSEREPVLQTLPATVETAVELDYTQDSTTASTDSASTDTSTTDSTSTDTATTQMPAMSLGTMVVGVSLNGRVIDPAGLSVADITIKAVQGEETLITTTDNNGNYQFALTQGVWSVSATDLDYDITPAQKVYQVDGASITRIE